MKVRRISKDIEADQEHRLLESLLQSLGDGSTITGVLVLGDGLNIQVARMMGRKRPDDWSDIVRSFWKDAGGNLADFSCAGSPALQWEALVSLCTQAWQVERRHAEQKIQKALCERLTRLEARRLDNKTLYSDILNAGFANIVSFNIDRRLIQHVPRDRLEVQKGKNSPLYRHVRVKPARQDVGKDATNVWFPYGEVRDPTSVQIGHSTYDIRLAMLEDYRDGMMDRWLDWKSDYSGYELGTPRDTYWRLWDRVESWYDLFFLAPLIFVGVSLSLDDWPLWWLLHQRARNFVPFEESDCPKTFYLTHTDTEIDHLKGAPAGIELVQFKSHDSMWDFLCSAIAQPIVSD